MISAAMGGRRRSAGVERHGEPPIMVGRGQKKSQSTGRLMEFIRTPPRLEDGLSDLEAASKLAMKAAELQKRGASKLSQWAKNGGNSAIDDVSARMRELMTMHSEQQVNLAEQSIKHSEELRKMATQEEEIANAEKKLLQLMEKEKRLEKEINKIRSPGVFSRKVTDGDHIRSQLSELLKVIQDREKAEQHLRKIRNDSEINKMFIFRRGMKGLSDAYLNYSENTGNIFRCHRELTELVPAIATEDVHVLKYEGMAISRSKVDQVRRSIENSGNVVNTAQGQGLLLSRPEHRRRSEPLRMGSRWEPRTHINGSPPPPYSPGLHFSR